MKCSKCHVENFESRKFCRECGARLIVICQKCNSENSPGDKFCGECGQKLIEIPTQEKEAPEVIEDPVDRKVDGERKYVTALFSDLSGYTALSEKLDPEEVKEIMSRIYGEISQIIAKYEGFIEKIVGDAVMALFGVPKTHEDDPIRAILAAREIHEHIEGLSPEIKKRIGKSISMHTGINTGLVVTGEVNMKKGTHGVAGDTINLASRLQGLAKKGEILVGHDTYHQTEGHFTFEFMGPTAIKGKADPVQIYKLLSQKERPITTRRLSGLRANLIGRKEEMAELSEAVENLRKGKGKIFSIYGDAGTGKSRLVEDFKRTLDLDETQWIEGHAYTYAQNIPYFPLIDFFNRVFQIEEKDSPDKIKEKIKSGIKDITENSEEIVPYVGNLYALYYPELKDVSAELWKHRLEKSVKKILTALAKKAPTVFLLEDLHWADRSFVELLCKILLELRQPAMILCVYRPTFSLFTSHQLDRVSQRYHEIRLQALSLSDTQDMLVSLLKTESIPSELKKLVQKKTEGNPFYLEELVNTLIESETLILENGNWKLTGSITEADISSSIHGLIAGRLDRLEKETKRILQEASVIGRAFLYEILLKVTELEDHINIGLNTLERLDLIRTRSLEPDLEYMFKHPLTQEVVYNGLLKKERQVIHEQVARVMESLFKDRLSEFYETLAYHFSQGKSLNKAVEYLVKAGEKSLAIYAVEEAHEYFKKAYNILSPKENLNTEEKKLFIDMLNSWGYVYYYLGGIKEIIDLFNLHMPLAKSAGEDSKLGMYYAWLGAAYILEGQQKISYDYLGRALELGERSDDQKVIGYACTWLTWTCSYMGLFDEGINFGKRAQEIAKSFPSDQYLFFKSLAGMTYIYYYQGNLKKLFEGATRLVDYGEKTANSRSKVFGYWLKAYGYIGKGDMLLSQKESENALLSALDPFYSQFSKITLGMFYFNSGQFGKAEETFESLLAFSAKHCIGVMSGFSDLILSVILVTKGYMKQGMREFEETQKILLKNHMKVTYALSESILGAVYTRFITESSPGLATLIKNIGFIIRNVPFADQKAEKHFTIAIEILREIGAKGFLGQAFLGLGRLHKSKKRKEKAHECFLKAVNLFQECDAHIFFKQAKEELASVGD